jgi:FMN phosphatase YigB (HAD superfamily)
LLFDLADVLYDASIWSRWLVRLLQRMGLAIHYQPFTQTLEREFLVDAYRGRCGYWQAVENCLRAVGLSHGQCDEVLVAAHAAQRRFDALHRPFPGVPSTLARLSAAGMPLAVVTNTAESRTSLLALLEQIGLCDRFRIVLSSRDAQQPLPDAGMYQAALTELELASNQAAYVGHDPLELDGAAAAGLRTIAFNSAPTVVADVHLARFEQLLQQVAPRHSHLLAG